MAMDGYEMNFKAGSNLNKFRIGLFGLVLLGYTALGAGAGAIWDKAGDHFNLYGSGRRERRMRNTYY
jgi:hypothetical protein